MNDSIWRSLLAGHIGLLVISVFAASPTVDETAHLPAGLAQWQLNRFELYRVNPPLIKMVAAAPVVLMAPVTDWSNYEPSPGARNEFELGRIFVEQNSARVVWCFRAARLACLPFVLLGCFVCHRWASRVYGRQAGLLAAGLWCFSPFILGHGSLITPDVAAASTGLLAVYAFRAWLIRSDWGNAFFLGVCTGIALLTKFTWAPLFPAIGAFGWIAWRLSRQGNSPSWRSILADANHLLVGTGIALLMINAVYNFDRSFMQLGDYAFFSQEFKGQSYDDLRNSDEVSHLAAIQDARKTPGNRFAGSWLGAIPVPLPACYLEGIDLQRRDFEHGKMGRSYLMGEWKEGGWWYYYIVGFLVKEPLAFLILLCFSALIWKRDLWRRWRDRSARSGDTDEPNRVDVPDFREDLLLIVPAVLVFWLVSRETGFNHHVRYIIPALPFLFVFASRIMVHAVRLPVLRWFVGSMIVWQITSVLWFAPHWLSYFNEIAGGPAHGDDWLVDSNIDWGQDLLNLKVWQEEHPEARPLFTLLGSRYDPAAVGVTVNIPEFVQQQPMSSMTHTESAGEEPGLKPEPGWYAVSVNLLQPYQARLYHPRSMKINTERVRWFKDQDPVDRAGYSIRIYHVSESPNAEE